MSDWNGIHNCLEGDSCLTGKGFISFWKGIHFCMECDSYLPG